MNAIVFLLLFRRHTNREKTPVDKNPLFPKRNAPPPQKKEGLTSAFPLVQEKVCFL